MILEGMAGETWTQRCPEQKAKPPHLQTGTGITSSSTHRHQREAGNLVRFKIPQVPPSVTCFFQQGRVPKTSPINAVNWEQNVQVLGACGDSLTASPHSHTVPQFFRGSTLPHCARGRAVLPSHFSSSLLFFSVPGSINFWAAQGTCTLSGNQLMHFLEHY